MIGPVCARALREGAEGAVRSVFERSFYVTLGGTWICVGPPELGAGPLNILCTPRTGDQFVTSHASVGDRALFADGTLYLGDIAAIACAAAVRWHPQPPAAVDRDLLREGLAAFTAALPERLPREGLAHLLPDNGIQHPELPLLHSAQAPAAYLSELVRGAAGGGAPQVNAGRLAPLLGLGPGLTPSGDDFIGGALVALSRLNQVALRDAIRAALEPFVEIHTNEISAAHLTAAAEGYGNVMLHNLLEAVLSADTGTMRECVNALAAVGHTSGWDAMAGAIVVLDAVVNR